MSLCAGPRRFSCFSFIAACFIDINFCTPSTSQLAMGLAVVDVPTLPEGTPVASGGIRRPSVLCTRTCIVCSIITQQIVQLAQHTRHSSQGSSGRGRWRRRTTSHAATSCPPSEPSSGGLRSSRSLYLFGALQAVFDAPPSPPHPAWATGPARGQGGTCCTQSDPGSFKRTTTHDRSHQEEVGSKNLKTLMRLLENPRAPLFIVEKMAEQTKT